MEMPDRSDFPGLYAGFWRRVLAWLIDVLVLVLCVTVLGVIGSVFGIGFQGRQRVPIDVLVFVFAWLYFAIQESGSALATIGKRVVRLQVVDAHGERISLVRATGRYISMWLTIVTCGIGFLTVAMTLREQALHDMTTDTFVVRSHGLDALRASPTPIKAGKGLPAMGVVSVVGGILVIIGLVYAFLPNFSNYVGRSEVMTAYRETRPIRRSIERYVSKNGKLPPIDSVAKMSVAHPEDPLLSAIHVLRTDDHVVIFPVYDPTAPNGFGGHDLYIEGTLKGPAILWSCHGKLSSPPIPTKYLPAICRH